MMINNGAIIGIGNVLQNDDGIGIKILKCLESRYQFPENVELVDGGTCGATLNTALADKQWLIILDALMVSGDPGEIRTLTGESFIQRPQNIKLSPHQVGFLDLIQLMRLEGSVPDEIELIGVVPKNLDTGIQISDEVDAAIDGAIETLMSVLADKDIFPEIRDPALSPDYWWLPNYQYAMSVP